MSIELDDRAADGEEAMTDEMERMESERLAAEAAEKKEPRKRRRSSNYALEVLHAAKQGDVDLWSVVKDGFVSEEQAVEHMHKAKLQGVFRAIRIATETYEAKMVTPEPVMVVTKMKK